MLSKEEVNSIVHKLFFAPQNSAKNCPKLIAHAEELLAQSGDLNTKYELELPESTIDITILDILLYLRFPKLEELIKKLVANGAKGEFVSLLFSSTSLKEQLGLAYKHTLVNDKGTFLHKVAQDKHGSIKRENLNLLLKLGLDINATNAAGETAAQIAFSQKNYSLLLLLIESGAVLSVRDKNGEPLSALIQKDINLLKSEQADLLTLVTSASTQTGTVTPERFSERLKYYANTYGIKGDNETELTKLRNLLNSPKGKQLLYADPIIINYLTRGDFTLDARGEPVYEPMEALFYQATGLVRSTARSERVEIPYRSSSDGFYSGGTPGNLIKYLQNNITDEIASAAEKPTHPYSFITPKDLYDLSDTIQARATLDSLRAPSSETQYTYIFSSTQKDDHIYATLTILNLEQQKSHCTIIFNSWSKAEYFNQMKARFNFGMESPAPVLDGSIDIQVNKGDSNCYLYTIELLKALYFIISNSPELRKRLEGLPQDNVKAEEQWSKLFPELRSEIQKHLPQFFRATPEGNTLFSYPERKKWLLERRWQIGQQFILNQHNKVVKESLEEAQLLDRIEALINPQSLKRTLPLPHVSKAEPVRCLSGLESIKLLEEKEEHLTKPTEESYAVKLKLLAAVSTLSLGVGIVMLCLALTSVGVGVGLILAGTAGLIASRHGLFKPAAPAHDIPREALIRPGI